MPFEFSAISQAENTLTIHFASSPFTIVEVTPGTRELATSVLLVFHPIALITRTIRPCVGAKAIHQTILELSHILTLVRISEDTLPCAFTV